MGMKFTTNDLLAHMGTCDKCGCHSYALRQFGGDALCPSHWDEAVLPRVLAIKEAIAKSKEPVKKIKPKVVPTIPPSWECTDLECHLLTA